MFKKKLHNFPLFFSGMKFIIQNNLIKKRLILMHLSYCYAVINMYNMVKIHINHFFIYAIGNLMQLSSTTIGKSKFHGFKTFYIVKVILFFSSFK